MITIENITAFLFLASFASLMLAGVGMCWDDGPLDNEFAVRFLLSITALCLFVLAFIIAFNGEGFSPSN